MMPDHQLQDQDRGLVHRDLNPKTLTVVCIRYHNKNLKKFDL